jgi:hypothetical protein
VELPALFAAPLALVPLLAPAAPLVPTLPAEPAGESLAVLQAVLASDQTGTIKQTNPIIVFRIKSSRALGQASTTATASA